MGPIAAPSRNAPAGKPGIVIIVSTNTTCRFQKTGDVSATSAGARERALELLPRPVVANEGAGARTQNLRLKRALLCQLSYSPDSPGCRGILTDGPCPHQSSAAATVGHTARRGRLGSCENTACKTRRVRMPPGAAYLEAGMAHGQDAHATHPPRRAGGQDAHVTDNRTWARCPCHIPATAGRWARCPRHARARRPCRF